MDEKYVLKLVVDYLLSKKLLLPSEISIKNNTISIYSIYDIFELYISLIPDTGCMCTLSIYPLTITHNSYIPNKAEIYDSNYDSNESSPIDALCASLTGIINSYKRSTDNDILLFVRTLKVLLTYLKSIEP